MASDEELGDESDVVLDEELGDESAVGSGEEDSNHSDPNSIGDRDAEVGLFANQGYGLGPPRGRKGVRVWFLL